MRAARPWELAKLIDEQRIERALVCVNDLQNVAHLYRFLNDHGVPSVASSSERSKHDREQSVSELEKGRYRDDHTAGPCPLPLG